MLLPVHCCGHGLQVIAGIYGGPRVSKTCLGISASGAVLDLKKNPHDLRQAVVAKMKEAGFAEGQLGRLGNMYGVWLPSLEKDTTLDCGWLHLLPSW